MEPRIQPAALGRPAEQVIAAHAVAVAMWRHEPARSPAKQWLQGMVAAGVWILGQTDRAPLSGTAGAADAEAIGRELIAAGEADLPDRGDPRSAGRMYARGVYRTIAYALGLRDEQPVRLSREVAEKVLAEQQDQRAA
jgi:hypothetical protein